MNKATTSETFTHSIQTLWPDRLVRIVEWWWLLHCQKRKEWLSMITRSWNLEQRQYLLYSDCSNCIGSSQSYHLVRQQPSAETSVSLQCWQRWKAHFAQVEHHSSDQYPLSYQERAPPESSKSAMLSSTNRWNQIFFFSVHQVFAGHPCWTSHTRRLCS